MIFECQQNKKFAYRQQAYKNRLQKKQSQKRQPKIVIKPKFSKQRQNYDISQSYHSSINNQSSSQLKQSQFQLQYPIEYYQKEIKLFQDQRFITKANQVMNQHYKYLNDDRFFYHGVGEVRNVIKHIDKQTKYIQQRKLLLLDIYQSRFHLKQQHQLATNHQVTVINQTLASNQSQPQYQSQLEQVIQVIPQLAQVKKPIPQIHSRQLYGFNRQYQGTTQILLCATAKYAQPIVSNEQYNRINPLNKSSYHATEKITIQKNKSCVDIVPKQQETQIKEIKVAQPFVDQYFSYNIKTLRVINANDERIVTDHQDRRSQFQPQTQPQQVLQIQQNVQDQYNFQPHQDDQPLQNVLSYE